jgi:hypothetical protein
MEPKDLLELIDACRPGTDDVRLPEMRALAERMEQDSTIAQQYERIQRLDSAVKTAMTAGPVPEGLASRLLAAIDRADKPFSDAGVDPTVAAASEPSGEIERATTASQSGHRVGRKRTFWISLTSLAAAIALVVVLWPRDAVPVTERDMPERVRQWTALIQPERWRTSRFPDKEFPPGNRVLLRPRRWQSIASRESGRLVCYDLSPPGGSAILLFVSPIVPSRPYALPSWPSEQPGWNTQGLCIASWMVKGLVYALAVEGGAARYKDVVRTAPPIAAISSQHSPTS